MKKQIPKVLRGEGGHMVLPPRLEGVVKNARAGSKHGKKPAKQK